MQEIGKILVFLGIFLIVIGLIIGLGFGKGWIGRLPGDIKIEKGNFTFYFPLTTSILISIILSFIFWLIRK
ncbi:DUF2905 domain-containing protein [Candidatus Methylacidiphilum fumarolicum]|uniref:DUF2905 domain-containing protein n=2 Tax=Candidatus Methylacidiphilum fumarolicum TaxID=591154 RepID=I0K0H5_METFB|nr:DUF2905 domain-containing protein [Candidatus Methylacidiphilum fumarolicum]MBW6414579.1 DUF2905 domain-containing protein [Candidatus Methylacidiphilum fumarolicum]TFE65555.1 hypothetical protein A7K73_02640 [Candidatus Methylacidiphilum fumarolicum]TFE72648.1 DUF2905 domain-containing protein [Candidatus Methylacidiphilum fumarolicum]TFE75171.1 DUF2905 domain-containing protein [Candidatus Methylacidiphilum fumarolicum]TFE77416.1 hypothetical protein A7D33_04790 [Candidatus Methylacidiphi